MTCEPVRVAANDAMSQSLLRLQAVGLQLKSRMGSVHFGPFDLHVRAGERIAILGPSGAGKSILLALMARDRWPSRGQVQLRGQPISAWDLPALSRVRAVLPQSHEVAFGLPVELVVSLGRVSLGRDPYLANVVRQAARLACIEHVLGRRFDTLSGGEKARVQLARVFAQLWDVQQGLLLVDEPLAALDPGMQLHLLDAMQSFVAQRGHALVAIMHDVNHVLREFDRMLLIHSGALYADMATSACELASLQGLYGVRFVRAHLEDGSAITAAVRSGPRAECQEAAA